MQLNFFGKFENDVRFDDEQMLGEAMKAARKLSAEQLMFFIVQAETLNQTSLDTRKKAALCRVEKEYRDSKAIEKLTFRTTVLAALIGSVATLMGACIGAFAIFLTV